MSHSPAITRLLLLGADPAGASTCLRIDAAGRVLARSRVDATQPLPAEPGARDLLAVAAVDLRLQWIELAAHSPAQALAAARLTLEERAAGPHDQLHVALGEPAADGQRLLAVVDEATMRDWRARATRLGLQPQAVVPDCMLLDGGADADDADDDGVLACDRDGLRLVRGRRLAFSAEPALAGRVIGERPLRMLDADAAEARFAARAVLPPALDLLQGGHARRDPRAPRRQRRLAVLTALALLSPLLLVAAQALYHGLAARALAARADALAAEFRPGLDAAGLHAAHARRIAAGLLAVRSSSLFDALQAVPGAQLDSYEFTPATGIRAGLLHPREDDLQALRERMTADGLDPVALDSQPVDAGLRSLIAVEALE